MHWFVMQLKKLSLDLFLSTNLSTRFPTKKKTKKKFFEPILNLYTTVNSSNKPRKVPYTDFGPKKTISRFQDFLLL